MSEEAFRELIIEQRNLLLSNMATFYPNARSGKSYYLAEMGAFPEYTHRQCLRDLAYLEAKGYVERRGPRSRKPEEGAGWSEAYWVLTPAGFEVAQRIMQDPALEI